MCAVRVNSKESSEKGRRGVAKLVRLSETNARIDFEKVEANKNYVEVPAVSYEIKVSFGEEGTIPEYVPFKLLKNGQAMSLSATMDKPGTKILFAAPASGYFESKFDTFLTDEKDAPITWVTKKGAKNTYRQADCLIEMTGGQWNGVAVKEGVWLGAKYWYRIYDNLTASVNGGLAVKGSGDGSNNLADFLDATVGGGEQIPFSENSLPEIQKVAKEEDRRFYINVAKGWIVSLVVPLPLDEEIGFLEEEVPEALREEDGE